MLGKVGDSKGALSSLLNEKLLTTRSSLIGKTIQSVHSSNENLLVLILFTDGTFCLLESNDYECRDYVTFLPETKVCTGYSENLDNVLIEAGLLSKAQVYYVRVIQNSLDSERTLKLLREEFNSLAKEFGDLE